MTINYFIDFYLSGKHGGLLEEFIICICLSLMVILALTFDRVFLKEPITQNPVQLIYKVNIQDVEVLSLTVKMSFLLVSTLANVNMEDYSQQKRWKMSKLF